MRDSSEFDSVPVYACVPTIIAAAGSTNIL